VSGFCVKHAEFVREMTVTVWYSWLDQSGMCLSQANNFPHLSWIYIRPETWTHKHLQQYVMSVLPFPSVISDWVKAMKWTSWP